MISCYCKAPLSSQDDVNFKIVKDTPIQLETLSYRRPKKNVFENRWQLRFYYSVGGDGRGGYYIVARSARTTLYLFIASPMLIGVCRGVDISVTPLAIRTILFSTFASPMLNQTPTSFYISLSSRQGARTQPTSSPVSISVFNVIY